MRVSKAWFGLVVLFVLGACSSSTTVENSGGGRGKVHSSCGGTTDCVEGLQCFEGQCLVRLSYSQCTAARDTCASVISDPAELTSFLTKCDDRCSRTPSTAGDKLGDECELFHCMVELNVCGGEDDPQVNACVNSKGWY